MNAKGNDTLSVLACQIAIPSMTSPNERDAHLLASVEKVRAKLSGAPVDLVVLPELSSIDYSRAAFAHLDELAEPLDGPSFRAWSSLAQEFGVHVCYGFARRALGRPRIAMGIVGPGGELVGHYDKLHLAQFGASMEQEYFARGQDIFTFTIRGFTLAPIICYDIRLPELSRTLAMDHGVDVILHCGAYFRDASFPTWHPFAVTRALENQVYFLSLNRAGSDYGQSILCRPWQDDQTLPITFDDMDEDFRVLTLDRASIEKARSEYTFLKDRLPSYQFPHR